MTRTMINMWAKAARDPSFRPRRKTFKKLLTGHYNGCEKKKKTNNLAGFKPIFVLLIVFKFPQHNEHVRFPHLAHIENYLLKHAHAQAEYKQRSLPVCRSVKTPAWCWMPDAAGHNHLCLPCSPRPTPACLSPMLSDAPDPGSCFVVC